MEGARTPTRDSHFLLLFLQMVADVHGAVLEPDPIITLERVNAYTGEFVRTVAWPPHSDEVVFTAGSVIVAMQSRVPDAPAGNAAAGGFHGSAAPKASPQPRQRFFMGHTAYVVAVAFDAEGTVMASAQDGKHAIIRLWDFRSGQCVAILNGTRPMFCRRSQIATPMCIHTGSALHLRFALAVAGGGVGAVSEH